MKKIVKAVAEEFGVTVDQIMSYERWQPLAVARQMAHLLVLQSTPYQPMEKVAKAFKRERTAMIHSRRFALNWLDTDPNVRAKFEKIKKKLKKKFDDRVAIK